MTYPSILDTHLHLIDRSVLAYPWLADVPALNHDFRLERYQAEAFRCGIGSALHMEVDVAENQIEAESEQVKRLAARPKSPLIGAISSCRPERADFPAFLERQLANPLVKGFRRVLHVVPDGVSLSPLFRVNVARLSGTGRPFDLCVRSDQIDKAIALVDLCPDVQFVLDHCGAPKIKEREEHLWRERIVEIARRPNVAVKISGVVAYADAESWTLDDIRPYVEHAIASFGWDRVVWGSDWPVCTQTASLSIWVAATHAIVKGSSLDEQTRLFRGNATRIWRLAA
ncbi:MAG: amidohydrolase [Roseiarcus sp.]|jgi:predicted TIM-barrel fold metal-dependent hydrolase|uniref:amidohydrolase family protein n=1 Tax=Roseiarcus sp. TaxID=1969460 RepID=UPI003C292D7E